MFVRIKTRTHTKKKAVQIVKAYREGSKVRQKVIQTVGYAEDQATLDELVAIAKYLKVELEAKGQTTLFPAEGLIQETTNTDIKSESKSEDLLVNLTDLREEKMVITGIHEVYGKIYDQIGFSKVFTKTKKPYLDILKDMVLARLANPSSKREAVSMLNKDFDLDLDLSKVYRAMDRLDDRTISRIEKQSYEATQGLLGKKISVAFYDCTTLYFESFKSDELKNLGYSKDMKFSQPQVLLSLIITEEGLPLGYDVFAGNTFEGNTLISALERLKEKYRLENITVISDSGLLSKKNISYIKSVGYKYIIGARLKSLPHTKQKEILNGIEGASLNTCEYVSKSYETRLGEERLVVRYSQKRADKNRSDREKTLSRLEEKLRRSDCPKSFMSNYGYKKYISYEGGKDKIKLNEEKLEAERQWDGISAILTNEEALSSKKLLGYYRELWQIENCFRIQKNDLKIRPIYHWSPRRVRSHISICYQAFYLQQYLRYRLRLQGCHFSTEVIKKSLLGVRQTILRDVTTGRKYSIPSHLNEGAEKIYKILSHKYNKVPREIAP